jgi:hypothetical protein
MRLRTSLPLSGAINKPIATPAASAPTTPNAILDVVVIKNIFKNY